MTLEDLDKECSRVLNNCDCCLYTKECDYLCELYEIEEPYYYNNLITKELMKRKVEETFNKNVDKLK